MGSILDIELN